MMSLCGPDGAANLPEYLLSRIALYGDSVAQIDSATGRKVTFYEIWEEVHKTGHWLRRKGVSRGSTVGICLENCLDYAPLVLGVLQAGAVAALYPPSVTPRELEHLISTSKPKVLVAPNLGIEQHVVVQNYGVGLLHYEKSELEEDTSREEPVELCPSKLESPALLLSSSGSTGLPKQVIIKHSNLLWAYSSLSKILMKSGKPALGLMPFSHAYGLGLMLMALSEGSPFVIMNKFTIKDFNSVLFQHKIHHLHVVPSMFIKLASDAVPNKALKSVRAIFSSAGAISAKNQAMVLKKLDSEAKLYHCFGMTECTHIVTYFEFREDKPGCSGPIIPCMKAKIINTDGTSLAAEEQGELCLQGPMVTCGYYSNPEADRVSFTSDRWLRTGDLAWIDKDGYLFIVDRIKNIIKYQGHSISVTELEHVINGLKGVQEAAVVGVQHELYGEVPRAYIVLDNKSKLTEEQVHKAVSMELSYYKWLRGGVKLVDSLPKTQSMKIDRKQLRAMT